MQIADSQGDIPPTDGWIEQQQIIGEHNLAYTRLLNVFSILLKYDKVLTLICNLNIC